jgi:predicted nuclease of predicted toxin-antitoxin system
MSGRPDAEIAAVCQAERRTVITLDVGFANTRLYPPSAYKGIVVIRISRQDKSYVLNLVNSLIPHLSDELLHGRLWIVEDTLIRVRE